MPSCRRTLLALALAVVAAPVPAPASAQSGGSYSLSRNLVSGGGTAVAGGVYQLAGALGQPGAVELAGGAFTLHGGFLAPLAGPTVDAPSAPVPRAFVLRAPLPNPARGAVGFAIELPSASRLTLAIYSVDGRLVRTLLDAERGAGFHRVGWDGRTGSGARAAPGVYFARAIASGAARTQRFVLLH